MPSVVLYDLDSRIPNLVLMKLSDSYKRRGYRVVLVRESLYIKADRHFASTVFSGDRSESRVQTLRRIYGDDIEIGGSGVSLGARLAPEIESIFPDYGLYGHRSYALGYLTRGCSKRCPFCVVPVKEGKAVRKAASFADFVPQGQRNVMLLDDNLLAYPWAEDLLAEMRLKRYAVNFSQSLDISYLNGRIYGLLNRIDSRNARFTKRMFYFACNSMKTAGRLLEKRDLLRAYGKDSVTVLILYGFDTHLSEDHRRFLVLRRLMLLPFFMEYRPIPGVPPRVPADYFDMDLDAVIRLTFRSNGQNWEKYLRWVNRLYFQTFGRYYLPLLRTIYRYNHKERIGRYLSRPDLLTTELYRCFE
jgi:hypothetical protein